MMYDIAAAASKGRRDYQEDAVAIDFQEHDGPGFTLFPYTTLFRSGKSVV